MTRVDIPEGTKIEKVIKGGENAFKNVMAFLNQKSFNGYVMVKREKDGESITSYMLIKNSKLRLGVREVVARDKKEPMKKVRKLYAGVKTLKDAKNDSYDKNATIELHTIVDIESIIKRYIKKKKADTEGSPAEAKVKEGPKRVGLFWGGKEEEETLKRGVLQEKLRNWQKEGYDVSELKAILSEDLNAFKAAFETFKENVATLKELAAELEILSISGFEKEVSSLKTKLKNPKEIPIIKAEVEALQDKMKKEGNEVIGQICLVCGFPMKDEDKCPRCGASWEKKIVKASKTGSPGLISGHCYLIQEEKPKGSFKLFNETLSRGYKGLCITRTNPKHFKELKDLKNTQTVWLTDKESATGANIPPILERIMYRISNFLRNEDAGCLMLDGIEYLVSYNSFDAVLRFIRKLVDEFSESKSILLVTVSPYTLKEQELRNLEREMEGISFEAT